MAPARPEYPRPQLLRERGWHSLNGDWDFAADSRRHWESPEDVPGEAWDATIAVPFAWETRASGIQRPWLERGWYRRELQLPADWDEDRIVLHFGAVHHRAEVWLDGHRLGSHVGGYLPFEFDLTEVAAPGTRAMLQLRVDAPNDQRRIPHGKQRSMPLDDYDSVCFTPTSGIWQSVWLERRPARHIRRLNLRGDRLDRIEGEIGVSDDASELRIAISDREGTLVAEHRRTGSGTFDIPIRRPRLWSPADPHLYRVEVRIEGEGGDAVTAHAGLRRFETDGEGFRLNGERVYLRGLLDQGYWPGTGMTAPSAEALRSDLELARDAGYNLVRKHIKLEDPIWLHEADHLGMLVWAEPPCPSRFDPEAAAAFEELALGMVERDGSHPSIVIWAAYNEEWGLDWDLPGSTVTREAAERAYRLLKEADPNRPVVENSGWAHVVTDIVDWHHYVDDVPRWARTVADFASGGVETIEVPLGSTATKDIYASDAVPRQGIPLINSEYGTGHTSFDRGWQLRWQTQELRRHDRLAGYIYCELTDIEHEMAGFLNFDRSEKELGNLDLAQVNAETTVIFDLTPVEPGRDIDSDGSPFEFELRISHHGAEPIEGDIHLAWLPFGSPARELADPGEAQAAVTAEPFRVGAPIRVGAQLPEGWADGRLFITLLAQGARRATGFLDVGPVEQRPWHRSPDQTPTPETGTDQNR